MYLNEIRIKNYKSIQDMIIPVKKYGNSYMSVFVGLNEAGKSNILEAIALCSEEQNSQNFNYKIVSTRDSTEEYVDLYYQYKFSSEDEWKVTFFEKVNLSEKFKKVFKLDNREKNVYLSRKKNTFLTQYNINWDEFNLESFSFTKLTSDPDGKLYTIKANEEISPTEAVTFKQLDNENLEKILDEAIFENIPLKQKVSIWKPDSKYLITESINLNDFSNNISSCIPLANIFSLCGFDTQEKIRNEIVSLTGPSTRTLCKKLSTAATKYVNQVWKEHNISLDINIEYSTKILTVLITDKDNETEFFEMTERSQGFKHFISLILNLSIANNNETCKDQIIIIDEPENHLHPSGIRYMRDELLKIGKNNYLFIATHSPFLVDQKNMDRHFIVKKPLGITSIKQIKKEDILDDEEVLQQGFGINILRDFLTPYKLLVEGMNDSLILKKAIQLINPKCNIGISNGHGANIVNIASLMMYSDISCFILLDDDIDGQLYRDKIRKLGNKYSEKNVKTLRDLCGDIIENGTIEDTIDKPYIQKIIHDITREYKEDFIYNDNKDLAIIKNLKASIHKNELQDKTDEIIEKIKIKIASSYNPSNLNKSPLLKKLVENLISLMKNSNEDN